MKHSYTIALLLLTPRVSFSSHSVPSSRSYATKESSQSSQQVSQQLSKNQAIAQGLKSLTYAKNIFNHLDTPSQSLVSTVAQKLQTTNVHDYPLYLGIFNGLTIIAAAQQKPMLTEQMLSTAYQDQRAQKQQTELIKNCLAKNFSEKNTKEACSVAQSMSNILVRCATSFIEHPQNEKTNITKSSMNAHTLPGLHQIKEFVGKFMQLSAQGKKTVWNLLLRGNDSEALKLISVGDKNVSIYDRTRKNTVKGLNPKCKVKIFSPKISLPLLPAQTTYTLDCPEGEKSSSPLFLTNYKCDYDFKNTIVCPHHEQPFEIRTPLLHGVAMIELAQDYYNNAELPGGSQYGNYVKNEFAVAKEYLKDFKTIKNEFSPKALTHLYAQALLIGQDIFNVDTLPVDCLHEIISRYQTQFTQPTGKTWTKENIKDELNAARKHLSSHVLFTKDMPQNFDMNTFQYAQAVRVMCYIADHMQQNINESNKNNNLTQSNIIENHEKSIDLLVKS